MEKIFFVIASHNGGNEIMESVNCIKRILYDNENLSLVLVDNASSDNSLEKIIKTISVLKLIKNKKNLGFAKAVNQVIKYSIKNGAKKVLILNQDATLKKRDFKILTKNYSDIVSPVIKFRRKDKIVYDLGGRLNYLLMRPSHLEKIKRSEESHNIDYVSGCCMLIHKDVIKKVGFFDERFFLYYEDVDYCLKASKLGFEISVELGAEAEHSFEDKNKKSIKKIYYLIKSHFFFINKWSRFPNKIVAYFYWFIISFKMLFNKTIYDCWYCFIPKRRKEY